MPALGTIASVAAAAGSCAAAYFAARSAEATQATVREMQADRRDKAKPQFSLELRDAFFKSTWTLDKPSLTVEVLPMSFELTPGRYLSLDITNFGGAALDLSLDFALQNDAPPSFPGSLRSTKIINGQAHLYVRDKWLSVNATNRQSQLLRCHSTAKVTLPHCGAGQTRNVFIPEELISFAFIRALTDPRDTTAEPFGNDPVQNMKNIRATFAPTYKSDMIITVKSRSQFEPVKQVFVKKLYAGPPQGQVHDPLIRDELGQVLTQAWAAMGEFAEINNPSRLGPLELEPSTP